MKGGDNRMFSEVCPLANDISWGASMGKDWLERRNMGSLEKLRRNALLLKADFYDHYNFLRQTRSQGFRLG